MIHGWIGGYEIGDYFEKGKEDLKSRIESDSETWEMWTKSDKRYMLICFLNICENNIDASSGTVTGHLECNISSGNLEDLKLLWKSKFVQIRFDTTRQHFIVDTKERKVVEFLTVCM